MAAFEPIYQYYVDAIRGRAEAQQAQMNVKLGALKAGMEMYQLQQQIQEQQIARKIFGDQQGQQETPGVFDPKGAGGSQPNANPSTGQDPTLAQADRMDAMGRALAPVNFAKAGEWFTKANTIRNGYYTRQKEQLEVAKQQSDAVGRLFGSVKTQEDYTNSLYTLQHDQGVDITKFGLSGTLSDDMGQLEKLAKQSLSYSQKLTAQHEQVTEQQAMLNYNEKTRHDMADEGLSAQKNSIASTGLALRADFQKKDLEFKARADSRAQAGVERTDAMDLEKTKDFVRREGKNDKAYADSVVAGDPVLSTLSPDGQKAASAEIRLRAREALAGRVKKPGDTPDAGAYMDEVSRATREVGKRVQGGSKGFLGTGLGATKPSLGSLPPAINSRAEFDALDVGKHFSRGGKSYTKTSKTDYKED